MNMAVCWCLHYDQQLPGPLLALSDQPHLLCLLLDCLLCFGYVLCVMLHYPYHPVLLCSQKGIATVYLMHMFIPIHNWSYCCFTKACVLSTSSMQQLFCRIHLHLNMMSLVLKFAFKLKVNKLYFLKHSWEKTCDNIDFAGTFTHSQLIEHCLPFGKAINFIKGMQRLINCWSKSFKLLCSSGIGVSCSPLATACAGSFCFFPWKFL